MKKTVSYISIAEMRDLLDRWYSGTATPAEEHLLSEAFRSERPLPEDMNLDRALFMELSEAREAESEFPVEYAERISSALEHEMAASRRMSGLSFLRGTRFRRIAVVAAVAVCFSFIGGVQFWRHSRSSESQTTLVTPGDNQGSLARSTVSPSVEDTLKVIPGLESALAEDINRQGRVKPKKGRGIIRQKRNDEPANPNLVAAAVIERAETGEAGEYAYLSPEEEAMLANSNYRIVTDSREAKAILNSIFIQLESRVDLEANNISTLNEEYEAEINKLNTIVNVNNSN